MSVCPSPLRLLSPDWSKFGYLHSDWSILRMRIAQVMPKIDLIVTADLPTARQTNILSVTSLRSLELENEKTGKEDFGGLEEELLGLAQPLLSAEMD